MRLLWMAPKRRASTAKAKGKAKAQAAAAALADREEKKTSRQKLRRSAVKSLNRLVEDLQLATPALKPKRAKPSEVEHMVQKLEPRRQHEEFATHLLAAVTQWRDNGGALRKLCLEFPARLQMLVDSEGDRLRK